MFYFICFYFSGCCCCGAPVQKESPERDQGNALELLPQHEDEMEAVQSPFNYSWQQIEAAGPGKWLQCFHLLSLVLQEALTLSDKR